MRSLFQSGSASWANKTAYGFSLARGVELSLLSGESVFNLSNGRVPNDEFNITFLIALILSFVLQAILAKRSSNTALNFLFSKVGPALMTAGIFLLSATQLPSGSIWFITGGFCAGFGSALLFTGWQQHFATNDETCDGKTMAKAFVGAPLVASVIILLGFPLGSLFAVCAIWGAGFLLEHPNEDTPKTSQKNFTFLDFKKSGAAESFLTVLVFAFVFGMSGQLAFARHSFLATNNTMVVFTLIAALIFLVFGNFVGSKTHGSEIYYWITPIIITVFILLPLLGMDSGIAINGIVVATYHLLTYNFLCFMARLSVKNSWPIITVTALTQSAFRLVMIIGIFSGVLLFSHANVSETAKLVILTLLVIYLLSMCMFIFLQTHLKHQNADSNSSSSAPSQSSDSQSSHANVHIQPNLEFSTHSEEHALREMCKLYSLTEREFETLTYLVRGYSVKLIAEELFVSPNTIKVYVRGIYEKTDVHNRDDLNRLVQLFEKMNLQKSLTDE